MKNRKKNIKSFILAAGYGSRLAPLTDAVPKPLISLLKMSLLENILFRLNKSGIEEFALNTHHLAPVIEKAVSASKWKNKIKIFHEPEILGTGGPLINARKFLHDSDAFLLHNGDIICDVDFQALIDFHFDSSAYVTMLMIDGPENKVAVNDGRVIDILGKLGHESDDEIMRTYAGISVFGKKIFDYLPENVCSCSIITAILELMKNHPEKVAAYLPEIRNPHKELYWNDLGTPTQYLNTLNLIQNDSLPINGEKTTLITPMNPIPHPGASDRFFFRISDYPENSKSSVVLCAPPDLPDNNYFVEYAQFFKKLAINAPEIISSKQDHSIVLMEDLGNDTIFSLVKKNSSELEIIRIYKKVIDFLIDFQIKTYDAVKKQIFKNESSYSADIPEFRIFDKNYYLWETEYFSENFLTGYLKLSSKKITSFKNFFSELADKACSHPKILIHRDFQSQNILLKADKVAFVDFQGARIGHVAYDIVSLLYDPYIPHLNDSLRKLFLDYYFNALQNSGVDDFFNITVNDFDEFQCTAALQRLMQALGAYAFLALKKNKTHYLDYIPNAFSSLKMVIESLTDSDSFKYIKTFEKLF